MGVGGGGGVWIDKNATKLAQSDLVTVTRSPYQHLGLLVSYRRVGCLKLIAGTSWQLGAPRPQPWNGSGLLLRPGCWRRVWSGHCHMVWPYTTSSSIGRRRSPGPVPIADKFYLEYKN